jgi:very-short-patch-repair endonuclease
VVARWQLAAVGLTPRQLERRVATGHLVRVHRGVYAVGHRRLNRDGYWLAAVLACGPGALLSHRDAAALHALLPLVDSGRTHVTTAGRCTPQRGIEVHGRCVLHADDVTTVGGIPVTTVARTLVDIAGTPRLTKAVNEAERLGKLDARALEATLARTRGRKDAAAAARLRGELARVAAIGWQLTRSDLEDALDALVRDHGLPPHRANLRTPQGEVDAAWPAQWVAVEVDGWDVHRGRAAFQRDRTKTNALTLAGWTVLRFTWSDITHRPAVSAAAIAQALAAAERRGLG